MAARPPDGTRLKPKNTLVFAGDTLTNLRASLLAEAPLESAAFVLARAVRTPSGGWRLVVHDVISVPADAYDRRTPVDVQLPPVVLADAMQRARGYHSSLILVHTHPCAEVIEPSPVDRAGESVVVPVMRRRIPEIPHGRLIIGPRSMNAVLFDVDGAERPVRVEEVGVNVVFHVPSDDSDDARHGASFVFDRQVRALGDIGQRRLGRVRVGIVGLGGTGSIVAQQLAHLGVSEFILIDHDVIELSNLNRVVGARAADIGRPKVVVAGEVIRSVNSSAKVIELKEDVRDSDTARRLLDADLFLCCTDSQGSRAVLSQLAYQYLLPGIDVGVAIHVGDAGVSHVGGRVQMLGPGLACLLCSGVLDTEVVRRELLTDEARDADPYIVGASVPQPAVISVNGVTSSLAVTMLLGAVAGAPFKARHQRARLETGVVSRVEVALTPGCPWCSPKGALCRGDSWPSPGRRHAPDADQVNALSDDSERFQPGSKDDVV